MLTCADASVRAYPGREKLGSFRVIEVSIGIFWAMHVGVVTILVWLQMLLLLMSNLQYCLVCLAATIVVALGLKWMNSLSSQVLLFVNKFYADVFFIWFVFLFCTLGKGTDTVDFFFYPLFL